VYALFSVATCSTAIAAGMLLIGRRYDTNYIVSRTFYAVCKRLMNIHVDIEGEEHLSTRPAVYMMNHQSMLDILVVGRLMPKQTSMMSKKSLQFTPLGPFMTLSGAIFIDRSNNIDAVRSLNAAGQQMKNLGTSLWMFPEGTRHSQEIPDLLPFKKGGFHLAVQAGIPIVPIVTENYWRMYRNNVFGEGRIKVRVLPPVPTTGLSSEDTSTLAVHVRDQMLQALRDISVKDSFQTTEKEGEFQVGNFGSETRVNPGSPQSVEVVSSQIPIQEKPVQEAALEGSSLAMSASASSLNTWKSGASENGTETEEDEGMILVGRPT
jgi:lysophosphatidate acyltransferase